MDWKRFHVVSRTVSPSSVSDLCGGKCKYATSMVVGVRKERRTFCCSAGFVCGEVLRRTHARELGELLRAGHGEEGDEAALPVVQRLGRPLAPAERQADQVRHPGAGDDVRQLEAQLAVRTGMGERTGSCV